MAVTLGEENNEAKVLGDDEVVYETALPNPKSAATERRDTAVLGATGSLPEELPDVRAGVSEIVTTTLREAVGNLQVEEQTVEEKAEELADQSAKGSELIALGDFFDNSFQAMKNPALTEAANLASIKYQLTVEKLQDAIEDNAAKTGAGTVANWFDRYILRNFPIGAFEAATGKPTGINHEFASAISSNMTVQDFEIFLDTKMDEFLEQGFFVDDNPFALQDLLTSAVKLGNDDKALGDAVLGAIDLIPLAGFAGKTVVKTASSVKQAREISKIMNGISKSPTASTRTGVLAGPDAATEVAENIAKRTDEPENLGSMGPSMVDVVGDKAPVRPLPSSAAQSQTANRISQEAFEYVNTALGKVIDESQLATYITKKVEGLEKKLNRSMIDTKVDYNLNKISIVMGNPKTGKPVAKATAEKYAADVPEASVIPIDEANNKWAISYDEALDLDQFVDSDKFDEAWKFTSENKIALLRNIEGKISRANAAVFGRFNLTGAHLRDNANATNLANRAESGAVRLAQISAPMLEKLGKLSGKEYEQVGEMVARLQSGDLASQRTWYTTDDFIDMWKADNNGQAPSQKVMDGYQATVDLGDYNYIVSATGLIKGLHREGYRRISTILDGEQKFLAGKPVDMDDLPKNELFIDASSGAKFTKADYDGPMANVFEVDMDMGGVKYVVDTDVVKPLEIEDAMGYNAGGPRVNPTATQFIVLLDKTGRPVNVVLSASSPKTATKAVKEMTEIYKALRAGRLTDEIVQENNSWNTSLNLKEDAEKWFTKNKIDLEGDEVTFNSKARNEKVFIGDNAKAFIPNGSLDDFNSFVNKRNDEPLTHYGHGAATVNDNPLNSILFQTNSVNRQLGFSKYTQAVQISLGKKIKEIADPNSPNTDYASYYTNITKWLGKPGDSESEIIRELHQRHRITDLRMGGDGFGDKAFMRIADDMSNFIYDASGRKYNPSNPTHYLNNYGFKKTFLLDPFQTVLQSVQVIPMVAMAGLDDGIKGVVMGKNLYSSLDLSGKPLDIFLERFGKAFDYSKAESKEIRQLFIDMARYEVDPTNIAEGFQKATRASSVFSKQSSRVKAKTLSKAWEKGINMGMFFFNKGEQISRVSAYGVAVRKWKAANKGKSLLSEEGRTWVSNKEQAYTLNMTNMSRSEIQQGILRVPTQFYSFMLRSFEGIFIGKDLTPAERMKLAVMMGPFWGTTGIGISNAVPAVETLNSYLPENMQIEPGSDAFRLVKNGVPDALFSWATGDNTPEIALASRVGLGDGVMQTFRNYRDGTLGENLLGAGGGASGDLVADFGQWIGSIIRRDPIQIELKTLELIRNLKFIDNTAKAIGMWNHGLYMSRKGGVVDFKFNNWDILFTFLGIPLEEAQQVYDSKDTIWNGSKEYRQLSKQIDPLIAKYWKAVEDRNPERAVDIKASIDYTISYMTGLEPELQEDLRLQVLKGFGRTTTFERIKQLQRLGLYMEAEQLRETVQ